MTFEDRLIASSNRPAGFEYLRVILALEVILFHAIYWMAGIQMGNTYWYGYFRPFDVAVLPMFFSLSGFLVAGSLARSQTLISFLGLRMIRLLPALLVEVVLSALILGPLLSTVSPSAYFHSSDFRHYFLNIVGDIHYFLPGVFKSHISKAVNLQLWTIPWEMRCYLTLSLFAVLTLHKRRFAFLMIVLLVNILREFHLPPFPPKSPAIDQIAPFGGANLVIAFLWGIIFYLYRDRLIWNRWLCVAAGVFCFFATSVRFGYDGDSLALCAFAYVTVCLGLTNPRRSPIVSSGDYSYGVYLYGWPIQQAIVQCCGSIGKIWYLNFLIASALAALLALGSWHLIEKRAALLRPSLFRLEQLMIFRFNKLYPRGNTKSLS